jgi:hypothetical protein
MQIKCSLNLLGRLADGRHGLGRAALLFAAAPALRLGLLGCVERRQDGEGVGHGGDTGWRRCAVEQGAVRVVVAVVAKQVSVADEGCGRVAVVELGTSGPGRVCTGGAAARAGLGRVVAVEGAGGRSHGPGRDADGDGLGGRRAWRSLKVHGGGGGGGGGGGSDGIDGSVRGGSDVCRYYTQSIGLSRPWRDEADVGRALVRWA